MPGPIFKITFRKSFRTTLLLLSGVVLLPFFSIKSVAEEPTKLRWILSTDMATDVDDAAAMGMLVESATRGKGIIAACVSDAPTPHGAPALRAFLDAWGVDSVPVGAYQGQSGNPAENAYPARVAHQFGKNTKLTRRDFPDAVEVLRQAYAESPDESVVFIAIGFLTALDEFLRSPADDISPMTGQQLFEKKTRMTVSVGANYIGNEKGSFRWNWKHAPEVTARVINAMNRPFYWLPANEIDQSSFPKDHPRRGTPPTVTGPEGLGWKAAENPIQFAFEVCRSEEPKSLTNGLRRKAFDPAAVRFATDFDEHLFEYYHQKIHVSIEEGTIRIDPKRSGVFSILRMNIPSENGASGDYLDMILRRLPEPGKDSDTAVIP